MVTSFAVTGGHVSGFAERVEFFAFSALMEEVAVGAGYAEGALRSDAVGIVVGIGSLCADNTSALVKGVAIIT